MFKIHLSKKSQRDLKKLKSSSSYIRIIDSLVELKVNPLLGDVKNLKNFPHSQYRKRIGKYRILFDMDINDKSVEIHRIIHRKDAYR